MDDNTEKPKDQYTLSHYDEKGRQESSDPGLDKWRHRAVGMRCASCMWFVEKAGPVGRCRRHAPTMNGYPVVYETDWCGDHKINETKI